MKKPLRLAIAGLGTVGSATLDILTQNQKLISMRAGRALEVAATTAQHKGKHTDKIQNGMRWIDHAPDIATLSDIDVVVLLIGGSDCIALDIAEAALRAGKSVVTANKALLAAHGVRLAQRAEETGAHLMFEASVGGGIPIIKTLREAATANRLSSIRGILNGTCNYILTRMSDHGLSFQEALKEAQDKGYAEADPATDIEGHDTAHKLALLAALAFGVPPSLEGCPIEGLSHLHPMDMRFARELGYAIKLLGYARRSDDGLEKWVGPCLVTIGNPLASTDGVFNAISLDGDALGTLTLTGRGAGGDPTASAVIADLVDLARGLSLPAFGIPTDRLHDIPSAPIDKRQRGWYVRLTVIDRAGVVADISTILRGEAISIESMIQRGQANNDHVPVIIKTHKTSEAALRRAVTKMDALECVQEPPVALRIEE